MTNTKNIIFTISAVLGVAIRVVILVNNIRRIYEYERNGGKPMEEAGTNPDGDVELQTNRSVPSWKTKSTKFH